MGSIEIALATQTILSYTFLLSQATQMAYRPWLPTWPRHLILIVYKFLHALTPTYISELLTPYSIARPHGSAHHGMLAVPHSVWMESKGECNNEQFIAAHSEDNIYKVKLMNTFEYDFRGLSK